MNSKKTNIEEIEYLPDSMKGYEIYVWQDESSDRFKLMTGSNFLKSNNDIFNNSFLIDSQSVDILLTDIGELKLIMAKLPEGTYVSLNSGEWWENPINENIKESEKLNEIIEFSNKLNINIHH